MMKHTQLRIKCLSCSLHYIICTWNKEEWMKKAPFCPECGSQGRRLSWIKDVDQAIFQVVPGDADDLHPELGLVEYSKERNK